ncbi:MAG: Gfo/Idh/MocA family oxidoreductase [Myxococcota bacterium]
MIDVAIAGAGTWGRNHVRAFASLPGARLRAVCDSDSAALERAARFAPSARLLRNFDQLVRADDVSAVVLATPAARHAEQARALLDAGKDVLVEKPMAMRAREAEALCELAEARGRVLMVGHIMRYHPAVERLVALVRGGDLGKVHYLHAVRVNLGRVRTDENALWSLAPHDVSVVLALVDAAPESVAARGASYLQAGIEDVVFVNVRFADGTMAQFQVSWLDPRKDRRLTVVGSKKMIVFDDRDPAEMLKLYDKGYDRPPEYADFGEYLTLRDGDIHVPKVEMREPLAVECAHFVDCVASRATPRTSGREGLAVVRVLEAAQRSLELGGTPVACGATG